MNHQTIGTHISRHIQLLRSNNVVAAEVHQSSPDDDDASFALELAANLSSTQFPPSAKFVAPPDGSPVRLRFRPFYEVAENYPYFMYFDRKALPGKLW